MKNALIKLRKYEVHTAISIDGDKETNDMIRRKGGYDKAIHAMEKLSSVGLLDCLVTTMTKHNITQMAHPAMLAEKYKARMLVYHNLVPVGRAGEHMDRHSPNTRPIRDSIQRNLRHPTQTLRHSQSQRLRTLLRTHRTPKEPSRLLAMVQRRLPWKMHNRRQLHRHHRKRRLPKLRLPRRLPNRQRQRQQNYAPHGKNCKRANCTLNYATKATSKADADSANTEKSAADAEHEQNSTPATSSNQTQHATTYPKSYRKTPKHSKHYAKTQWEKYNKPTQFLYPI